MRHFLILAALLALLAACGHGDSFRVKGSIEDGSSLNIRFVYYSNDAVLNGLTAATDGHFEFEGNSPELAVVEVYDNDYRLLSRFLAQNGQDITLKINRNNYYLGKAGGNDYNKELWKFYNENADILIGKDIEARNRQIADYVANQLDSPVAALLLSTEFAASADYSKADSLARSLKGDARQIGLSESFAFSAARTGADSVFSPIMPITYRAQGNRLATFSPQHKPLAVIVFSDGTHGRDSVLASIKKIAKHDSKIALLDLNLDSDTLIWTRTIRNDSATWEQGWAAGAISGQSIGRLGIPSIPYFILADSLGTQLWRGESATEIVSRAIESLPH